ncbi:GntR family transcriptional regulator [Bacillus fonticola]|uniref:GntR family transcriptional regulator n=1 Tax=Bacillus fonticola TaxID=2728853 RepID=UPI0014760AE2|nr:GntR family transcriptional regulator [Bacillus fonticola]
MIIRLDLQSEVPIYTQLKHTIIEGIAAKELAPGEALPSVRAMAADLGVNMHTVNKAYQALKQDGFIHIHRQKGVVVNPDGMPPNDDVFVERVQSDLRPLVTEAVCRGMSSEQFLQFCSELFAEFKE